MKKNKTVVALAVLSILSLASCGNESVKPSGTSKDSTASGGSTGKLKIAMLTDAGSITDGSYNGTTWDAISSYQRENQNKVEETRYFQPSDANTASYEDAIAQAAAAGFNTIICPGFYFSAAFEHVADDYPDIKFVGLDFNTDTEHDNVVTISYKENESGVLAGYAAVMDGYRNLAFFGGAAQPAPIRYGLGYVFGAYYAAHELGITDFSINPDTYFYCGKYLADPSFTTLATSWYENYNVDVIFTAAGGAGDSVISASDAQKKRMIIGVDTDESNKNPNTVITSATKGLKQTVYRECDAIFNGTFEKGHLDLGIKEDCCDVVLGETCKLKADTITKTKLFIESLKEGSVKVPSFTTEDTTLADFKTQVEGMGYTVSDALLKAIRGSENA